MDYNKNDIGKHIERERVIERIIEKDSTPKISQTPIDVNALATAIAQVMKNMSLSNNISLNNTKNKDVFGFDNSKTLERLANSMTVQRGNNESNFTNLGNEHQTKINKEEITKTINMLSNLDD